MKISLNAIHSMIHHQQPTVAMLYIAVTVKLLNEFCIHTATATTAALQFLEDVCNSVLVDNDFCALKDSEKDIVKGI